jgi:hypothetical protein
MQNKTYTTAKPRCSHTGITAAGSAVGSGVGDGFSRLVEVKVKRFSLFYKPGFYIQVFIQDVKMALLILTGLTIISDLTASEILPFL